MSTELQSTGEEGRGWLWEHTLGSLPWSRLLTRTSWTCFVLQEAQNSSVSHGVCAGRFVNLFALCGQPPTATGHCHCSLGQGRGDSCLGLCLPASVCFGSSSGDFSCWGIDMQSGTQAKLVSSGRKVLVETLSPTHAHPWVLTQPGTRSTWHILSQGVQNGSDTSWGAYFKLPKTWLEMFCPLSSSADQEFVPLLT